VPAGLVVAAHRGGRPGHPGGHALAHREAAGGLLHAARPHRPVRGLRGRRALGTPAPALTGRLPKPVEAHAFGRTPPLIATTATQVRDIFDRALEAVRPDEAVRRQVRLDGSVLVAGPHRLDLAGFDRVTALGMGKAAAAM